MAIVANNGSTGLRKPPSKIIRVPPSALTIAGIHVRSGVVQLNARDARGATVFSYVWLGGITLYSYNAIPLPNDVVDVCIESTDPSAIRAASLSFGLLNGDVVEGK